MTRFSFDERPPADRIARLYSSAGLRRPVDDRARIARMYEGSNLVVTAWDGDDLVGILRGWTDGSYDGYICDLAVDSDHQKSGIGRELLKITCDRFPDVAFVLRASIIAANYYEHLGWEKIENGWAWPRPSWE